MNDVNDSVNTAGDYVESFLREVVGWIPELLGALVLLIIGYAVAKVVAGAVRKLLDKAELDERMHGSKGGGFIERAIPSPSNLISRLAFWVIFLFGLSLAVAALGIPALVDFLRGIYAYIPNVIAAVLIFLVASAISVAIVGLISQTMGDTPTGKLIGSIAPVIVMGIGIFMILNQLKIAPAIVTITYAALVGSAALGAALAFGLGGRDVASRILEDTYTKAQAGKGQAKRDMRQGLANAKSKINDI